MNAYIDSSVLLRVALDQPGQFKDFSKIDLAISSSILKSECLRTLDRLVTIKHLSEDERLKASGNLFQAFDYLELVSISDAILDRVAEPLGLNLGTLDAIHLFSAVSWKQEKQQSLAFITHDIALGKAAMILGFEVFGIL